MKIVYIVGLGHSGSTILDMALGCNKNIVGLGEVFQILQAAKTELAKKSNFNDALCSCGQSISNCKFWSHTKQIMISSKTTTPFEKYVELVEHFKKVYGKNMILVDSSKSPFDYLLQLNQNYELKIIFLVRDVRSWVYSRHSRLNINFFKLAWRWFKGNLKILMFMKKNKLDYKTFGYEEIALYPEEMLKRICEYIGVRYDAVMLVPDNSQSHVFDGNVAKGDQNKKKTFFYDARWLTSLSFIFLCPFIFPLLIFNRKIVYSNFMKSKTRAFGKKQRDFLIFGDARKEDLLKNKWGNK